MQSILSLCCSLSPCASGHKLSKLYLSISFLSTLSDLHWRGTPGRWQPICHTHMELQRCNSGIERERLYFETFLSILAIPDSRWDVWWILELEHRIIVFCNREFCWFPSQKQCHKVILSQYRLLPLFKTNLWKIQENWHSPFLIILLQSRTIWDKLRIH